MTSNYIILFLMMLFCHIIDDYFIQAPALCNLKQKSWWDKNAPDDMYKGDYIVGLIMHSISWSFMIMLPIFNQHFTAIWTTTKYTICFAFMFVFNAIIHAYVDNIKANRHEINLIVDQIIHVIQIIFTLIMWWMFSYI